MIKRQKTIGEVNL